jgi:hypothetical protein
MIRRWIAEFAHRRHVPARMPNAAVYAGLVLALPIALLVQFIRDRGLRDALRRARRTALHDEDRDD